MVDKTFLQKGSTHVFLITISILVILAALGVTLWRNLDSSNTASGVESTLELSGTVTEKSTSCGKSTLREDGTIKKSPWICDAGEHIVVSGKSIATSSGGPGVNGFGVNIDSIKPGDEVIVHYVLSETGSLTLDCQSCSIVRTKHIDRSESF